MQPYRLFGLMLLVLTTLAGAEEPQIDRAPPPRYKHAMAFDSARGRVVLYGGYGEEKQLDDTWEWDGTSWYQVSASEDRGPAAEIDRGPFGIAWDAKRGVAVLASTSHLEGKPGDPDSKRVPGQTWEWSQRSGWALRTTATPDLWYSGLASDSTAGGTYALGMTGYPYGSFPLWKWDAGKWSDTGSTLHADSTPDGSRLVAGSGRARLFFLAACGMRMTSAPAVAHQWDGSKWSDPRTAVCPPARQSYGLAFDRERDRAVLFGGSGGDFKALGDTWEWDGASWTRPAPGLSPAARRGPSMAYSPGLRRVVMHGGAGDSPAKDYHSFDDFWAWDGKTWSELTAPRDSPHPARGVLLDVPAALGQLALFDPKLAEIWTWDGNSWSRPGHRKFRTQSAAASTTTTAPAFRPRSGNPLVDLLQYRTDTVRARSCMLIRKMLAGAVTLHELDTSTPIRALTPTLLRSLIKNGYVTKVPDDPGQPPRELAELL